VASVSVQDFTLAQFFREDDDVEYALENAKEIFGIVVDNGSPQSPERLQKSPRLL
jgi:hypothetical protein